jgi:glycosyltransferase involved in cell wall biosynthesis
VRPKAPGGGSAAIGRSESVPKVSVFILTYNHAAWIAQAIESALMQEARFSVEILIADDCSTDGTRAIVQEYARRRPDAIRTFLPERNLGVAGIWLQAARRCRGEYVAILEGDDHWTSPEKLARQAALLDSHRDWVSCFHGATLFDDEGRFPPRPATPAFDRHVFELDDVLRSCFIPFLTVMFRRAALARIPEWVFSYAWFDWLFHIHCAHQGKIGHFEDDLAAYRVHGGGNWSARDRSTQIEEDLRVYSRLLDELSDRRELIERCIEHRHCQLAVEASAIPFDTPVLLLEASGDMQPYFNGRHGDVLSLGAAKGRFPRALDESLAALRRAAEAEPPPTPHYPPRVEPRRRSGAPRCACLVPASSLAALSAEDALRRVEEAGRLSWRDEWCRIWEVEIDSAASPHDQEQEAVEQMGALVEISDVSLSDPLPESLAGGFIDEPKPGATVDARALDLLGWALGAEARATAVEFAIGGEVFWRAPLRWERPDLADAFPEQPQAARAGFRSTLNMIGTPAAFELEVSVVLAGQGRARLGTISGRHRWRRDRSPAFAELVSVIVPCFGQAHYLGEAIESVLSQSYPHLELLVVDDASPDNVSPIASRYPGVRCIRGEEKGVSAARNAGIRNTNGDFLVFLDADDRLLPNAIETGLRMLAEHEECACAIGAYRRISHAGEPLNTHEQPPVLHDQYAQLMRDNWAGFPGRAIYRRSVFEHVKGFDSGREMAEDFALSLDIARQFPIWSHAELVAEHREHDRNSSGDAAAMLTETLAALRGQRTFVKRDPALRRAYREGRRHWKEYYGNLLASQARGSLREGRPRDALREAVLLARYRPSGLLHLAGPARSPSD